MKENNILSTIAAHKQQKVAVAKQLLSQHALEEKISLLPKTRDFIAALNNKLNQKKPAVIAEIKKASPSKGIIREDFDPILIAKIYERAGAACLSILTDEKFFQGKAEYIKQVHACCELPILRKDFIIDPYQIYESRYLGADCILLIAALLSEEQLIQFNIIAKQLGLAVLLEIHDAEELKKSLKVATTLLGINNRDLKTFKTDLNTTINLLPQIPANRLIITESGIHQPEDVTMMRANNVHCFLVGESLMKTVDIALKFRELFT
jgi:indole-3-glycerol phosphate synthase